MWNGISPSCLSAAFECLSILGSLECPFIWHVGCLCAGKKMLFRFIKVLDFMKMHYHLLDVQVQSNFPFLIDWHPQNQPILTQHPLTIALVLNLFIFVDTFSSHPPYDLSLCSGFRLCKRDEFTGVNSTLLFEPNCKLKAACGTRKAFNEERPILCFIQLCPRMFHFFHVSQDITGSDEPCSCPFHGLWNCVNTVSPPARTVVGWDFVNFWMKKRPQAEC